MPLLVLKLPQKAGIRFPSFLLEKSPGIALGSGGFLKVFLESARVYGGEGQRLVSCCFSARQNCICAIKKN